jgi:hypothetical protein
LRTRWRLSFCARSEDDPDVIATWSLFELDQAGYEALRDDPEWMSAELGRVERMSQFETEVLASGFFHVLEEIVRRRSRQTERQSQGSVAGGAGAARLADWPGCSDATATYLEVRRLVCFEPMVCNDPGSSRPLTAIIGRLL